MTGMVAAVAFEALKLRRSTIFRVSSVVLALTPLAAAGLMAAAASQGDSSLALKARSMITDSGWSAYFAITGQIFSVAVLMVVGLVACWMFGREFTDRTIGALTSLPVSRGQIAAAKFIVILVWSAVLCAIVLTVTVLTGLVLDMGAIVPNDWLVLGKVGVAVLLTALITSPLAFAASAGRGYLTGIACLLALVVLTQIVTAIGYGTWFPYAAAGLWLGLGGPDMAQQIGPLQLMTAIPVCLAGIWATIRWWRIHASTTTN